MISEGTDLSKLGAGETSTVFIWQSYSNVALKIANKASLGANLEKEFNDLCLLKPILNWKGSFFKVPHPINFVSSFATWKKKVFIKPQNTQEQFDSCALIEMERIWPIPPQPAQIIRQKFLHEKCKEENWPFICPIYLGKELGASSFYDNMNFPLDAVRLNAINLDVGNIATEMGKCLALIHFKGRRDGCGVKFVLGGKHSKSFAFFCMDFNLMSPWENYSDLLKSFSSNNPCYPSPGSEYWEHFKLGYIHEVEKNLKDTKEVASVLKLLTKISNSNID